MTARLGHAQLTLCRLVHHPRCAGLAPASLLLLRPAARSRVYLRKQAAIQAARGIASTSAVRNLQDGSEAHLSQATAASDGVLQQLGDIFLAAPIPVGSVTSFTALIILSTLILRTGITLPVTIWQRNRIRRVQDVVVPKVKAFMESERYRLRTEFRKANRSYEDYVVELQRRTKVEFKRVSAKNKCRSLPTLITPILVNIPLFITVTLTLRDICLRSYASLTGASTALSEGVYRLTDTAPLSALGRFALEDLPWCHSIADADPTLALPVAVTLSMLINVELQAGLRTRMERMRAGALSASEQAETVISSAPSTLANQSASGTATSARPPSIAHPAVRQSKVSLAKGQTRRVSSSVIQQGPSGSTMPALTILPPAEARSRIITNVLRVFSILFLPIGAVAPVAVNVYWLTSNVYSIIQNLALAFVDKHRLPPKVKKPSY